MPTKAEYQQAIEALVNADPNDLIAKVKQLAKVKRPLSDKEKLVLKKKQKQLQAIYDKAAEALRELGMFSEDDVLAMAENVSDDKTLQLRGEIAMLSARLQTPHLAYASAFMRYLGLDGETLLSAPENVPVLDKNGDPVVDDEGKPVFSTVHRVAIGAHVRGVSTSGTSGTKSRSGKWFLREGVELPTGNSTKAKTLAAIAKHFAESDEGLSSAQVQKFHSEAVGNPNCKISVPGHYGTWLTKR